MSLTSQVRDCRRPADSSSENRAHPATGPLCPPVARPPMIMPNQHRHLTGALAAFAARMAVSASLPVEQLRLAPLHRKPGTPKPLPRQGRPAPAPSRQFLRAMSTQVARDRRLAPSATCLVVLLVAVAGKGGHVDLTRGYLAARLGVSGRTVARLLAQLRAFGYIATRQTVGTHGETTGLRVALLDPLLPYWEADQPSTEQGVTELAGLQGFLNKEESRRLAGRFPVLAYPRYRGADVKKLVAKANVVVQLPAAAGQPVKGELACKRSPEPWHVT